MKILSSASISATRECDGWADDSRCAAFPGTAVKLPAHHARHATTTPCAPRLAKELVARLPRRNVDGHSQVPSRFTLREYLRFSDDLREKPLLFTISMRLDADTRRGILPSLFRRYYAICATPMLMMRD